MMRRAATPPTSTAATVLALCLALGACSSLWPAPGPQPAYFALQAPAVVAAPLQARALPSAGPVLVVQVPRVAPGFDSARIIYTRQPHRLEYFAHHEWVDAPARMLAPLMVAALESSGGFSAVVLAPSAATGALQLDTQLLRLQQEFGAAPSRVRLTLRAQLIHTSSRHVLATHDFEHLASGASDDAPGGVAAAQVAVQAVLAEMAAWCRQAAATQSVLTAR
jgi:cholesterol transport system auxiliary component